MNTQFIEVFVDSVTHFYKQIGLEGVEIESPYLLDSKMTRTLDYTGIIGVSGKLKGYIYFSCPKGLLSQTLLAMGEDEISDENCCDMVGEVVNTISGNARKSLGADFLISVPKVVTGEPEQTFLPNNTNCIIVPIRFGIDQAIVVVGVQ